MAARSLNRGALYHQLETQEDDAGMYISGRSNAGFIEPSIDDFTSLTAADKSKSAPHHDVPGALSRWDNSKSVPASPNLTVRKNMKKERVHKDDMELQDITRNLTCQPNIGSPCSSTDMSHKRPGIDNHAFDRESLLDVGKCRRVLVERITPEHIRTVKDIFKLLRELKSKIKSCQKAELLLLNRLLNSNKALRRLILDHKVKAYLKQEPLKPTTANSHELSRVVCQYLQTETKMRDDNSNVCVGGQETSHRDEENNIQIKKAELNCILQSSDVKAVLQACDEIASNFETNHIEKEEQQQEATRQLEEITEPEVKSAIINGQQVKVITLTKSVDPLGATIKNDGESIVIARIVKGGLADKTKLLKVGDEIISINDVDVYGKSIDAVADLMATLSGTVKFVVKPETMQLSGHNKFVPKRQVTVRAQFDYDPEEDFFIPCLELGISFQIGDILHIINRDDKDWWQAYREGDDFDSTLAGLIPSRLFWETLEQVKRALLSDTDIAPSTGCCTPVRRRPRRKKSTVSELIPSDPILTFEEVTAHSPAEGQYRPIVLAGCDELKLDLICQKIVEHEPDRYTTPCRVSSQSGSTTEETIPLSEFQEKITTNEMLDYRTNATTPSSSKYSNGICKTRVLEVINNGKVCIFTCQPKSIPRVRCKDIKPYIIYIASPQLERLKSLLSDDGVSPTVAECQHVIDLSRHYESTYSHLFNYVVTHVTVEATVKDLTKLIEENSNNKQWVPADWLPRTSEEIHHSKQSIASETPKEKPVEPKLVVNIGPKAASHENFMNLQSKSRSNSLGAHSFANSPRLKRLATPSPKGDRKKNLTPQAMKGRLAKASPLLTKSSDSKCKMTNDSYESLSEEDCV